MIQFHMGTDLYVGIYSWATDTNIKREGHPSRFFYLKKFALSDDPFRIPIFYSAHSKQFCYKLE